MGREGGGGSFLDQVFHIEEENEAAFAAPKKETPA